MVELAGWQLNGGLGRRQVEATDRRITTFSIARSWGIFGVGLIHSCSRSSVLKLDLFECAWLHLPQSAALEPDVRRGNS